MTLNCRSADDAYNALMSDRITDKEQFIDSILAIYGTLLIDDEIEEDGEQKDGAEAAMKHLKKRKLLEMPDGTKAEYLTRTFDEAGVEILKKAVEPGHSQVFTYSMYDR